MKSHFTILPIYILAFLALIVLGLHCQHHRYAKSNKKSKTKQDAGYSNAPNTLASCDGVDTSCFFLQPTKQMSTPNEKITNTRAFTAPKNLEEYLELLDKEYQKICHDDDKWSHFNGFNGLDPCNLQLKAIYDQNRHIMFKLTTTQEDVVTAAYAERDWILAENEIDRNNWRMAHSPILDDDDQDQEEKTDLFETIKKLTAQIGHLTEVVDNLKNQVKSNTPDKLSALFTETDDVAVRSKILKILATKRNHHVYETLLKSGIGMEDLIS